MRQSLYQLGQLSSQTMILRDCWSSFDLQKQTLVSLSLLCAAIFSIPVMLTFHLFDKTQDISISSNVENNDIRTVDVGIHIRMINASLNGDLLTHPPITPTATQINISNNTNLSNTIINLSWIDNTLKSDIFPQNQFAARKQIISKQELWNPQFYGNISSRCIRDLPNYVVIGTHHKTGVVFANMIKLSFFQFCNIYYPTLKSLKHEKEKDVDREKLEEIKENNEKYFTRFHHWTKSFPSYYFTRVTNKNDTTKMNLISDNFVYHRGCDNNSVSILHFIRSPLNMILSAYNYHKLCPKMERDWINNTIRTKPKVDHMKQFISKDFFQNKIGNYSLCEFYNVDENIVSLIDKLYYEFVRVRVSYFDHMKIVYKLLEKVDFGFNFRMENYTASKNDFDKFASYLIQHVLNLKFDLKGNQMDRLQYDQLMNLLRMWDINRVNTEIDSNTTNMHKVHVTGSLYNKTYQTDLLLKYSFTLDNGSIINVCQETKQMTLELDYLWQWNQYC